MFPFPSGNNSADRVILTPNLLRIKTHHNVGGLPAKMNLKLIEPLRELFKDEVRVLGTKLGLSEGLVWRHPFPGPGLGIRIVGGEVTPERLDIVRRADNIFIQEIKDAKLYNKMGQAYAALLPVDAVGVMGDKRVYGPLIGLRAVETEDFMTASKFESTQILSDKPKGTVAPFHFDWAFLENVQSRIINEVEGVCRVLVDGRDSALHQMLPLY